MGRLSMRVAGVPLVWIPFQRILISDSPPRLTRNDLLCDCEGNSMALTHGGGREAAKCYSSFAFTMRLGIGSRKRHSAHAVRRPAGQADSIIRVSHIAVKPLQCLPTPPAYGWSLRRLGPPPRWECMSSTAWSY